MKFKLEKGIAEWRTLLRRQRGFEEGDIDELEDHFRSRIEEYVSTGLTSEEAYHQVLSSDYADLRQLASKFLETRKQERNAFGLALNFMKVGLRSLQRNTSYSLINVLGLAIGFASVFSIFLFIDQELSFDSFNEHYDDIYRVNLHMVRASGELHYPIIPPAFGPAIQSDLAGIERVARLRYAYPILMRHEQNSFFEKGVFFAEANFLKIFSHKLLLGNSESVLTEPNTVVITESIAEKYFGKNVNPIGETIEYNSELSLEVVGVIEQPPVSSHFKFDFLISFETFEPGPGSLEPMTSWKWLGFLTYVQLSSGVNPELVQKEARALFLKNNAANNNLEVDVELQALSDIYLQSGNLSNPQGGLFRTNDPNNLRSLAIVAVLIIIIGFFNYFNIAAALITTRSKEVGIRKLLGSSNQRIFLQLTLETSVVVLLSGIVSLVFLAAFSEVMNLPGLDANSVWKLFIFMLVLSLSFGLINGIYLGLRMISTPVMSLLRNSTEMSSSKFSLRRAILFIQYAISAGLVMISLIIVSQLNFFSEKDLGYEKDGILVVGFRGNDVLPKKTILKNLARTNAYVKEVSFGPALDGSSSGSPLRPVEWPDSEVIQTAYFGVDYEFADVIGIQVKQGRFFDETIAADSVNSLLINETLAERLGYNEPLNKKVIFAGGEVFNIIGVFNDFNHKSLHHQIGPMALTMWLGQPRTVLFKLNSDVDTQQAIASITEDWHEAFVESGLPFEYQLLEDQLAGLYQKEADFGLLIKGFTAIAIFTAILGLYGFSSLNARLKLKQICIRRVLGAGGRNISRVIGGDFMLIGLTATIGAIPVVYFLMSNWLQGFAYHIPLSTGYFVMGIAITIGVSIMTLLFQVQRVMNTRPASILRDE